MAVVDDLGHSGPDSPPRSEDFGRQPPQDLAAEQSVLGGMLLSKDASADGRCHELPQPGGPIASPDEPGRVPCALRPPPLR